MTLYHKCSLLLYLFLAFDMNAQEVIHFDIESFTISNKGIGIYTDNFGNIITYEMLYSDEFLKEGDFVINDMVSDSLFSSKVSSEKDGRKHTYIMKLIYKKIDEAAQYEIAKRTLLHKDERRKEMAIKFNKLPAALSTNKIGRREFDNVVLQFDYHNEIALLLKDELGKLSINLLKNTDEGAIEEVSWGIKYPDNQSVRYFKNEHFLVLSYNGNVEFIYGVGKS